MAGEIRISYDGKYLGEKLRKRAKKFTEKQRRAVGVVAKETAEEIEQTGRADIAAGGNFGSQRWQAGFRAFVSYVKGDARIRVTHAVKYWRVFAYGAVIHGKPLLWIPLSFGQAVGKRARDYGKPLFRVNRPGRAPLLLDDNGPQYFGKASVTIPKKWHLREITRAAAVKMGARYKKAMKTNG